MKQRGAPADVDSFMKARKSGPSSDPLVTGAGMEDAAHAQARPTALPNGGQPSFTATALSNSPSGADPHNPGNPNLDAVPESAREDVNDSAFKTALGTTPLVGPAGRAAAEGVPGVMRLGRALIGAGAGGYIGKGVGSSVGGMFGETGREVGGAVVGLGGSLIGGGMAGGLERRAPSSLQALRGEPGAVSPLPFGIQRFIPDWMVPGADEGTISAAKADAKQRQLGSFMDKGFKLIGEPAQPQEQGIIGQAPRAPGISNDVQFVREPRPTTPEDRPGSMWSVKRQVLPSLAGSGQPGALDVMRALGGKALIIPESAQTEYPGPRTTMKFPSPGAEGSTQPLKPTEILGPVVPQSDMDEISMSLFNKMSNLMTPEERGIATDVAYSMKPRSIGDGARRPLIGDASGGER